MNVRNNVETAVPQRRLAKKSPKNITVTACQIFSFANNFRLFTTMQHSILTSNIEGIDDICIVGSKVHAKSCQNSNINAC